MTLNLDKTRADPQLAGHSVYWFDRQSRPFPELSLTAGAFADDATPLAGFTPKGSGRISVGDANAPAPGKGFLHDRPISTHYSGLDRPRYRGPKLGFTFANLTEAELDALLDLIHAERESRYAVSTKENDNG